jgi:hypothetical protein
MPVEHGNRSALLKPSSLGPKQLPRQLTHSVEHSDEQLGAAFFYICVQCCGTSRAPIDTEQ